MRYVVISIIAGIIGTSSFFFGYDLGIRDRRVSNSAQKVLQVIHNKKIINFDAALDSAQDKTDNEFFKK